MFKKIMILLHIASLCSAMDLSKAFGAGVLPFAMGQNNKVVILLGKEYVQKEGKELWCGFSGGSEGTEQKEETAVREFGEETRWVYVANNHDHLKNMEKNLYFVGTDYMPFLKREYYQFCLPVDYQPKEVFCNAPVDKDTGKIDYEWIELQELYRNYLQDNSLSQAIVPLRKGFAQTMAKLFSKGFEGEWDVKSMIHEVVLAQACKDAQIVASPADYHMLSSVQKKQYRNIFEQFIGDHSALLADQKIGIVEYDTLMQHQNLYSILKENLRCVFSDNN